MMKPDFDKVANVQDYIRRLNQRREKKNIRKHVVEVVFRLFCVFIGLAALNQGFNVCTRLDGNCRNHSEHLLFTSRNASK
jgi:regulator of replication initiation timing